MTAKEITRQYFPDISDRDREAILWGLTGFPHFWHIPEQGSTPEECLRKQLAEVKQKMAAGQSIEEQLDACWITPKRKED